MYDLISIIVPVYNQVKYLKRCVDSILLQTWKNIEVILVDDGSTDETPQICDEIAESDNRIKVIHKSNEGLSAARITGLRASQGKWILFVDDDDLISIHLVEVLMLYGKQEDVDIVAGGRIDTSDADNVVSKLDNAIYKGIVFYVDDGKTICQKICTDNQQTIITPMWGKLYKRTFLVSIELEKYKRLCPTIYFEDVLMTPIIYCQARKICIVKIPMYVHREVGESISRSGKLSTFYYEQIDSGEILLNFYKNNNMREMYDYELNKYAKVLFRLVCLDDNDERVGRALKQIKKYRRQILVCKTIKITNKIAVLLTPVFPNYCQKIYLHQINNRK